MSPPPPPHAAALAAADAMSASGQSSEKLSLPTLQSKMKIDPEGYTTELTLIHSQFKSSIELFNQQASFNFGAGAAETGVSRDLGERALFLAHMCPFYPEELRGFGGELVGFLKGSARALPSGLRVSVVNALILMINRQVIDVSETLSLFMELQILGDRALRKLAFSHVIHSIKRMNQKHKNEAKNRALQNILFELLQEEDETKAKRALITLCDLHRRKIWFDDRTANAICSACFHPSSRIMIAALSFLLDYEKIENNDEDTDASSSDDDLTTQKQEVILSKEAVYKAHNKGTVSSKKKKQAKLQRVMRSLKKQQRLSSQHDNSSYYSPLNNLRDAQGFAEKLFSRLRNCHERFEVKMMIVKVVARTIGLHRLILLDFYPFLEKYVQSHQRDVTSLLAAAVQACHDMVPPDSTVKSLFKHIVTQFVHERSRPEAVAVGLNTVREICLRIPLLMTEELLQDLVLYKKDNEKAVSSAARSLVTLFRQICPSLLVKKDRGRPVDPKARPKAYGEVSIASDVPGIELLKDADEDDDEVSNDASEDFDIHDQDKENNNDAEQDDDPQVNSDVEQDDTTDDDHSSGGASDYDSTDEENDNEDNEIMSEDESDTVGGEDIGSDSDENVSDQDGEESDGSQKASESASVSDHVKGSKGQKRKFADFEGQLSAASNSLRALKKLAAGENSGPSSDASDAILSNEDFKRIRELKAKKDAKIALSRHGMLRNSSDSKPSFKVPTSEELSVKRVDATKLEAGMRRKMTKEERLASIRAGREDEDKYRARAAIKKKKTGGLSNKQKQHNKPMPVAAVRQKVKRSRMEKRKKQDRRGKQFRGRKAWK